MEEVIIGSKYEDGSPVDFQNGDIIKDLFGNDVRIKLSDDHTVVSITTARGEKPSPA